MISEAVRVAHSPQLARTLFAVPPGIHYPEVATERCPAVDAAEQPADPIPVAFIELPDDTIGHFGAESLRDGII